MSKHENSISFLVEIISRLEEEQIPYLVIGALAAAYHGAMRASVDADALLFLEDESIISKLIKELSQAYEVEHRVGDIFDPVRGMIVVTDKAGNKVDLLLGIKGISRDAIERGVSAILYEQSVRFIGLEDFIASKIYAGGPQDLSDAEIVIKVAEDKVNHTLLETLINAYGEEEKQKLRELLHSF